MKVWVIEPCYMVKTFFYSRLQGADFNPPVCFVNKKKYP